MLQSDRRKLEICVDTASGLMACKPDEVDRVELCSALALGGLTPSAGMIGLAANTGLSVHAMIRPRAGDFCFDRAEVSICCRDIAAVQGAGLAGVVLGATTAEGTLDTQALHRMVVAAGGLEKTLHRAIDVVDDPFAALEAAIALGFNRVLTSGAAPTAQEGAMSIARLVTAAAGRISVMAGSGVSAKNVGELVVSTGVRDVHASARTAKSSRAIDNLGFAAAQVSDTDPGLITNLRSALDAA